MDKKVETEEETVDAMTQGYQKLWNYFLEVVKKEHFHNKISYLREKYDIPKEGYKSEVDVIEIPPEIWSKKFKGNVKEREKAFKEIREAMQVMCKKYHLHTGDWGGIMLDYLFYNILQPDGSNSYNLCFVGDFNGRKNPFVGLSDEKYRKSNYGKGFIESDNQFYPIAIRISPYATENDIVDYVKKMSPLIKEFQKPYINAEAKIGKVKRKKQSIQDRNEFIYQNKNLSLNKISELVYEKFGESLDYEYIGKIKSMETKKRKEL